MKVLKVEREREWEKQFTFDRLTKLTVCKYIATVQGEGGGDLIRLIAHSIYKYVSTISLLRPCDVH